MAKRIHIEEPTQIDESAVDVLAYKLANHITVIVARGREIDDLIIRLRRLAKAENMDIMEVVDQYFNDVPKDWKEKLVTRLSELS